jgi:hypothetical protein
MSPWHSLPVQLAKSGAIVARMSAVEEMAGERSVREGVLLR